MMGKSGDLVTQYSSSKTGRQLFEEDSSLFDDKDEEGKSPSIKSPCNLF